MDNLPTTHHWEPVFNQALSLLRAALWGEERFPFQSQSDPDWEALYRELRQQTVQHLPSDLLAREDPGNKERYTGAAVRNLMRWYQILQVQQETCQMLKDAGIACAVIKGTAAAIHYPVPANRVMGDIDLLIQPEHFDSACRLMEKDSQFLGENSRHREYRRKGVVVELHRAFATFRDNEKNTLLDSRLFGVIGSARHTCVDGFSFPMLPLAENGLVLLTHIDVHLENGLGLRQILDWMLFAHTHLDDETWEAELAPMVRQLDREVLAVTVTRMCQLYLGLRQDITWCAGADERLCRQLMEYILSQGNFGRKTQTGANRATSFVGACKNIPSLFRILQHRGCINWKLIQKLPFLKPFAWLYQLLRYVVLGIRTRHPLQLLLEASHRAKDQTAFLEELGVTHMAEEGNRQ